MQTRSRLMPFKGVGHRSRKPKVVVESDEDEVRYYHFNVTITSSKSTCEFGFGMPLKEAERYETLTLEGKSLCHEVWEIEGLEWYTAGPNYLQLSKSPAFTWQSIDGKIIRAIATITRHISYMIYGGCGDSL